MAGLCLLLYPKVSNYWNALHQTRDINQYVNEVVGIDPDTYAQMMEAVAAHNRSLLERENQFRLTEAQEEAYPELLNISGNGIMGYIEIPVIDVALPIYHGTSHGVLQTAVGHLDWTSLPVGGEGTHCVLSGHRGLPSSKLFTDLDKLVVKDIFTMRVLDETLTYEVDQILIVEPEDASALQAVVGTDYCTLVTCTPYGINTHRLLVRGHRIENIAAAAVTHVTADAIPIEPMLVAPVMFAGLLLAVLLAFAFVSGWNTGKRRTTMKSMKSTGKRLARVICFALIAVLLPVAACARTTVDPDRPASLTVQCEYDGRPLHGVRFRLYRVADVDVYGRYQLAGEFSSYPVALDGLSAAGWKAAAMTLAQYAGRDALAPAAEAATDADGAVAFAGLAASLYLASGDRYTGEELTYDPAPFLVSLPNLDAEDRWIYDVSVAAKGEGEALPPEPTEVKVLKVWDDQGAENRPDELDIQLLRDGIVFETVSLGAGNSWRHTWSDLDAAFSWSVVEADVPEGYQVSIAKEGVTYVITNAREGDRRGLLYRRSVLPLSGAGAAGHSRVELSEPEARPLAVYGLAVYRRRRHRGP